MAALRLQGAVIACWVLGAYAVLANVLLLFVVRHDKRVAQRRGRGRRAGDRVPERAFLMAAVMGGGVGGLAGCWLFRHKTRKARFMVPFVMATVLGVALVASWAFVLGCPPFATD